MKTYRFDPAHEIRRVVLVGCGGTGSHLARSIARILYDMGRRGLKTPATTFVDPDVVSPANVGRQMWTAADALADPPLNKAETLARRFNLALGLAIDWDPTPFDPGRYDDYGAFIVGAVDNHLARRAMAGAGRLWLDCGNHYSSGQIVLGTTDNPAEVVRAFERCDDRENGDTVSQLPNAALLFPELLEPEEQADSGEADLSCAELVRRGEQALLVNDLVAAAAAQIVYKLLGRAPIDSFITYVDAETVTVSSKPITRESLSAYGLFGDPLPTSVTEPIQSEILSPRPRSRAGPGTHCVTGDGAAYAAPRGSLRLPKKRANGSTVRFFTWLLADLSFASAV